MNGTYLEKQIARKVDYNVPYYGRLGDVTQSQTSIDNFPYNRFFVSQYDNPDPQVFDRKAGYRVLNNKAYACPKKRCNMRRPDLCFSTPSTTTYPCYPPYFYEYASEVARNNAMNRHRINVSV